MLSFFVWFLTGISEVGILIEARCEIKGKKEQRRNLVVPFPYKVQDENMLKTAIILMASNVIKLISLMLNVHDTLISGG